MRRLFALAALIAALAVVLCSCSPLVETQTLETHSVYATFYPYYVLTELVTQGVETIRLSCLVQPQSGCLRNYSLSEWDMYLLQYAQVVVAGGLGLESFESTLQALGDEGPVVALTNYNYTDIYDGVAPDQTVEDSHFEGTNPHLYMSCAGAQYIVESIALALSEVFPSESEALLSNMEDAVDRIDELRREMAAAASGAQGGKAILLNEALVYLARELGVEIAGMYDRESGETEHESDIALCLEALASMDAQVVLVEKQAPASLVSALEQAGYATACIDVLSFGRADMGATGYFEAQLENANAIGEAFARQEEAS